MSLTAVIGANWGDEGKGLVTDYVAEPEALVVRFNGGAQAGHTVVTPEGLRHVFGHVGAGAFRECTTLLSRFFLVNPMLFLKEHAALRRLGVQPTVYVDPLAAVTTPWDMLLNRTAEAARGGGRHGSCGVGINETVVRQASNTYALHARDLFESDVSLEMRLTAIRDQWTPLRAADLRVQLPVMGWLLESFLQAVRTFRDHVEVQGDVSLIGAADHVVFEGAQGLRLDEQSPDFPHVTRSRTGLTNVLTLLRCAGRTLEPLDVYYVTRCYATRHGAGPLPQELPGHPGDWTGPETNVTNDHQGAFRYARLDLGGMTTAIHTDLRAAPASVNPLRPQIAMTCLDQVSKDLGVTAVTHVTWMTRLPIGLLAYGPARTCIVRGVLEEPLVYTPLLLPVTAP